MAEQLKDARKPLPPKDLQQILKMAKEIAHGSINLIVQDGFVIQVDRYEKIRLR